MLVRLAFSLMMQVDADVLLIDEVLAVGDAAFQQKCADAFHEMKAEGEDDRPRHPLDGHRQDLLRPGDADRRRRRCRAIGEPGEVGRPVPAAELRARDERRRPRAASRSRRDEVRLVDIWTEGAGGGARGAGRAAARSWSSGPSSRSSATCAESSVGFLLTNADGVGIFQFGTDARRRGLAAARSRPGAGSRSRPASTTRSSPGRYFLHFGVSRGGEGAGTALYVHNAIDFVVFGGRQQIRRDGRHRPPDRGRHRGGRGSDEHRGRTRRSCARSRALGPRRRLAPLLRACSG